MSSTIARAAVGDRATAPDSPDDRGTSLAEAGPYASSLIVRQRAVLLEWEASPGRRVRRPGRLNGGARPGGTLEVELSGAAATGGVPRADTPVTLVVPVHDVLWRFATIASEASEEASNGPEGVVSLAWPSAVARKSGRRFARVRCVLPVRVAASQHHGAHGAHAAPSLCTYTLDVSIGGVQLAVPRPLSVGTVLQLAIRLPQETVTAEATVAWARPLRDEPGDPMYGTGVRFSSLAPRAATRLRALLAMSDTTT